jgi:hypothetical protein
MASRISFTARAVLLILAALPAPSQPARPAVATGSAELEALHAHFERVVTSRHNRLYQGIDNVAQWERRKTEARAELAKMLWHDAKWPATPPPATVTHREVRSEYTIENIVLETAPKVYVTANLYLPRAGVTPFPIVLYAATPARTTTRSTAPGLRKTASRLW